MPESEMGNWRMLIPILAQRISMMSSGVSTRPVNTVEMMAAGRDSGSRNRCCGRTEREVSRGEEAAVTYYEGHAESLASRLV